MADSKLKIDVRRNKILDILRQDGKVYVSQLSKSLGATPVTIRNDLASLERDGYLIRLSGGAVLANRDQTIVPTAADCNDIPRLEEKRAIAKAVVQMIQDGDTLFINSGTTTFLIAMELCTRKNLNIVTNSLSVACKLGLVPTFRVLLLGGEINAQYGFTCGGDAQEQLSRYQADWAILAVDGISYKGGITTYHAEEAIIDRMMVNGAKHVLITADHTKIGRTGFSRVCDCNAHTHLITNDHPVTEELTELIENGISVTMI